MAFSGGRLVRHNTVKLVSVARQYASRTAFSVRTDLRTDSLRTAYTIKVTAQ